MKWSEKADHKPKEIGITLMVTLLVYGHVACLSGPRASASFIRPSVPGDPGVGRRAAETKNQKPGAQKPGARKLEARFIGVSVG